MRSAAAASVILVLAVASCGPSESERTTLRADHAAAGVMTRMYEDSIQKMIETAPSKDSALAVLRGPLMDSAAVWGHRLEEARYEMKRAGLPLP